MKRVGSRGKESDGSGPKEIEMAELDDGDGDERAGPTSQATWLQHTL